MQPCPQMKQEYRRGFSTAEKTELWDRWQRGESLRPPALSGHLAFMFDKGPARLLKKRTFVAWVHTFPGGQFFPHETELHIVINLEHR